MGWHQHAACKDMATGLFYDKERVEEAKAVCDGCPVIAECRSEAERNREEGVWGGETEQERYARRRRAGRKLRPNVTDCPCSPGRRTVWRRIAGSWRCARCYEKQGGKPTGVLRAKKCQCGVTLEPENRSIGACDMCQEA